MCSCWFFVFFLHIIIDAGVFYRIAATLLFISTLIITFANSTVLTIRYLVQSVNSARQNYENLKLTIYFGVYFFHT